MFQNCQLIDLENLSEYNYPAPKIAQGLQGTEYRAPTFTERSVYNASVKTLRKCSCNEQLFLTHGVWKRHTRSFLEVMTTIASPRAWLNTKGFTS